MILRKAKKEEALEISKVQAEGWRTTYNTIIPTEELAKIKDDNWKNSNELIIDRGYPYIYIVEIDGKIVGDIVFGKSNDTADTGEIYALYVLKEYQKKGIGKVLLEKALEILLEEYSDVILKVLKENHNARKFYERLGFGYIEDLEVDLFGIKLDSTLYRYKKDKID